jgi:hypothetical protein
MWIHMARQRSEQTTPLSEWLDRNQNKVSRVKFAEMVHLDDRQNLDRYSRGDRRPGLDVAFDMEDVTRKVSGGKDVLTARTWWLAPDDRPRRQDAPAKPSRKKSR